MTVSTLYKPKTATCSNCGNFYHSKFKPGTGCCTLTETAKAPDSPCSGCRWFWIDG